jgi:hypothetical protein
MPAMPGSRSGAQRTAGDYGAGDAGIEERRTQRTSVDPLP